VRKGARGQLCPVCIRSTDHGTCVDHGPWEPHQLLTAADRGRTARELWHPYTPAPQACPRCLGDVAESPAGFVCLDHGHDPDPHGPFRVDQLLGPSAQRESARQRTRIARRAQARERRSAPAVALPLPDAGRTARVLLSATIIAGTLAYLVR
jgi:hypothetical protein